MLYAIKDWDDAYANVPNIPDGASYPGRWTEKAKTFRDAMSAAGQMEPGIAYGVHERQRFDLFLPQGTAKGTVIFVHGGYWMRFDTSFWSHLAAGPLANGFAVAMLGYRLCPEVAVSDITKDIGTAVDAIASRVEGPLFLTGHSAGGHLVTRMVSADSPLKSDTAARIGRVVSISGVHDLRPLLATTLNETLRLDADQAAGESPALKWPRPDTELIAWVGAGERGEFIRQNALLANAWLGLGARTQAVEEPDRHHFNVIEGLEDATHPLTLAVTGQ